MPPDLIDIIIKVFPEWIRKVWEADIVITATPSGFDIPLILLMFCVAFMLLLVWEGSERT